MQQAILVTGATGTQGAAVIAALRSRPVRVRALVRNPHGAAAEALTASGIEPVGGDMDDGASLAAAMAGVSGVFSMQVPPALDDRDREVRHGRNLVQAALKADVQTFVHTSVARAGDHESFVGWAERRWWPRYWTSKAEVNAMVAAAGFPHWTILKPAYMMENFIPPKSDWMFPGLRKRGVIESVIDEGARLDLVAAGDVGEFAAAALGEPGRLHGLEIDLAGDSLTMREVARQIALATGQPVQARQVSVEEAARLGNHAGLSESQQWASVEGYKVDIERAASHGIVLTSFATWAASVRDRFAIDADQPPASHQA